MPGVVGAYTGYAEETPVSSAARTTSSNSGAITSYSGAATLRAQLEVTAASGTTPTLDVVIEDTLDGTNWNVVGTFVQKVTTGREVINVHPAKAESATFQPVFADRLRVRWTVGGTTPSFTFSVVWAAATPGN